MATAPGEVDPGPFTYTLVTDDGGNFTSTDDVISTTIGGLTGDHAIGGVITGTTGVSDEGMASLTFGESSGTSPFLPEDDHTGNPLFPPALPPDAPSDARWGGFISRATNRIVPRARDGVDFVAVRTERTQEIENIYWNEELLGTRPDAEIEALAREMAASQP
jgi:hypothetical protein